MTLEKTSPSGTVRLLSRSPAIKSRALITGSDFWLCFTLPFYAAIAWTVPERFWAGLCRRFLEPIDRKGSNDVLVKAVEASGLETELSLDGAEISQSLNASRIESYFQYLRSYRPGGWTCDIAFEGKEALEVATVEGRGAVLWISHFVFNGIAPKKALAEAGYQVAHLSRPEHGFSVTRFGIAFLNGIRSKVEDRYLLKRITIHRQAEERAVREAHRILKRGDLVSITAGAWEGRQIASIPLGRGSFPLATGAAALAHSTQAKLIPVFVVRERREGRPLIRVILSKPIAFDSAADRIEALHTCVEEFSRQQFHMIKRYPDQWRGWKYVQ